MSPVPITLTSHGNSHFERWNMSFNENKMDGVDLKSNHIDYNIEKNRGVRMWKIYGFLRIAQSNNSNNNNNNNT